MRTPEPSRDPRAEPGPTAAPGPPLPVNRSRPAPPEGAGPGRGGSSPGQGRSGPFRQRGRHGSPGLSWVLPGTASTGTRHRVRLGAEGRGQARLQLGLLHGPSSPSPLTHTGGLAPAPPHQAGSYSGPSLQGAGSEIPQSRLQKAGRIFQKMSLPQPARSGGLTCHPLSGTQWDHLQEMP